MSAGLSRSCPTISGSQAGQVTGSHAESLKGLISCKSYMVFMTLSLNDVFSVTVMHYILLKTTISYKLPVLLD